MNLPSKSASIIAMTALMPLTAHATMIELTDAELRGVDGRIGLGPGFQTYRQTMGGLWTDMSSTQGNSAALHYAGYGSVMTGYTLTASGWAAIDVINKAPPPINQLNVAMLPLLYVEYGIGTAGLVMLSFNANSP